MFKKFTNIFSQKKEEILVPVATNWRSGMWVIWDSAPHILFKVGEPAEIHRVDKETGKTVSVVQVSLSQLRQATYDEIPPIRCNITKEAAKELGYAS